MDIADSSLTTVYSLFCRMSFHMNPALLRLSAGALCAELSCLGRIAPASVIKTFIMLK